MANQNLYLLCKLSVFYILTQVGIILMLLYIALMPANAATVTTINKPNVMGILPELKQALQNSNGSDNLPATGRNLKIVKHPATYFQRTKDVYTQYDFAGVVLVLPISKVLAHAKEAIAHVDVIQELRASAFEKMAKSFKNGSSLDSMPANTDHWTVAVSYLLEHKYKNAISKIMALEKNIDSHLIPSSDFLQGVTDIHSARKRSVNIEFNMADSINAFWNGVTQIFHWQSLSQVQRAVTNVEMRQEHLTSFTIQLAEKTGIIIHNLALQQQKNLFNIEATLSCFMLLDEAEEAMDVVQAALTPMLQGIIPTVALDSASVVDIFNTVKQNVAAKGLILGIDVPNDILNLKTTTYQRNGNWELLLAIPTMDPSHKFDGYNFINFPTLSKGLPVVWDVPEAIFAANPMLYPEQVTFVQIKLKDIHHECSEYQAAYLCTSSVLHQPTCLSDLFHNTSSNCQLKPVHNIPTLQTTSQELLFFFLKSTEVLLKCPQNTQRLHLEGLYTIEDRPNCMVSTTTFTFTMNGKKPSVIFVRNEAQVVAPNLMPNITEPDFKDETKELDNLIETFRNQTEIASDSSWSSYSLISIILSGATSILVIIGFVICIARAYNWFN